MQQALCKATVYAHIDEATCNPVEDKIWFGSIPFLYDMCLVVETARTRTSTEQGGSHERGSAQNGPEVQAQTRSPFNARTEQHGLDRDCCRLVLEEPPAVHLRHLEGHHTSPQGAG